MEAIGFDGYIIEEEKLRLCVGHLPVPARSNGTGPRLDEATVTDDILRLIATRHARSRRCSGTLERQPRHAFLRRPVMATSRRPSGRSWSRSTRRGWSATRWGSPRLFEEAAIRTSGPARRDRLAVTGAGGDVLFVEAASMRARHRPRAARGSWAM